MPPKPENSQIPIDGQPIPGGEPENDDPQNTSSVGHELLDSLAGHWKMDLELSELPIGITIETASDITVDITQFGSFVATAVQVTSRINNPPVPEFTVMASLTIQGRLIVTSNGSQDEGYEVAIVDKFVSHRDFAFTGIAKLFDFDFVINPIMDFLIGKLAVNGHLKVDYSGLVPIMTFSSGEIVQKFTGQPLYTELLSLRYINDHKMMYSASTGALSDIGYAKSKGRFSDPGIEIKGIHWSSTISHPASFTRGDTVVIEVSVLVNPAGKRFQLFGKDKKNKFMCFESTLETSLGKAQNIVITAQQALPTDLILNESQIDWTIHLVDDNRWSKVMKSGTHRIYTTLAKPFGSNSCNKPNRQTDIRMNFVMEKLLTTTKIPSTPEEVAMTFQHQVNNYENTLSQTNHKRPIAGGKPSTLNMKGLAEYPDNIWGLLDYDNVEQGNCGEATLLMEQMMRLLGIPARQTHVYGSTNLKTLGLGTNVIYQVPSGTLQGLGREVRFCSTHNREESLSLIFNPLGPDNLGLNDGEGCVEVDNKLYSGLVSFQAGSSPGKSAAWNMLICLEDAYGKVKNEYRLCKFQAWTYQEFKDGLEFNIVCDQIESGSKIPGYDVPR